MYMPSYGDKDWHEAVFNSRDEVWNKILPKSWDKVRHESVRNSGSKDST